MIFNGPKASASLLLFLLAIRAGLAEEEGDRSSFRTLGSNPTFQIRDLSLKEFPKDLGESFLGLFSKENLPPLLIGVGASRLEESVHHLSDIVAGAALGCLVGRTVVRRTDKKQRVVTCMPIISVDQQTFGVAVQAQF